MGSSTIILLIAVVAVSHLASSSPVAEGTVRESRNEKVSSTMLDKVNIDTYLRNTKAVKQQIKCVLKNGPCDAVGKQTFKTLEQAITRFFIVQNLKFNVLYQWIDF
jgi:hypothetical protein